MANRSWNDLSDGQKAAVVVFGLSDLVFKGLALRDLRRRPASEIRGRKWLWFAIVMINSGGLTSLSYLRFGRKR